MYFYHRQTESEATCTGSSDISEVTSGGKGEIENVQNDRPSDSPLPTDATFKTSLHFLYLWSIGLKGFLSDLEKVVH